MRFRSTPCTPVTPCFLPHPANGHGSAQFACFPRPEPGNGRLEALESASASEQPSNAQSLRKLDPDRDGLPVGDVEGDRCKRFAMPR